MHSPQVLRQMVFPNKSIFSRPFTTEEPAWVTSDTRMAFLVAIKLGFSSIRTGASVHPAGQVMATQENINFRALSFEWEVLTFSM
jgi:hypothetical protein